MSSPPGARTLRVPCGRGAPDVFTAWGPNFASAVWSRSARRLHHLVPNFASGVWSRGARCLHRLCPNWAGAVRSRSARRLHHLGPELGGYREVAERPMSSPPEARTLRVPRDRGVLMSPPSGARTLRVPCGGGALDASAIRVRTRQVLCGRGAPADAFTTWGPNFASTVWSRSARCLHHLCANSAGCREVAERSMSPPPGPEHCGCREVAECSMSPPSGAPNIAGAVWSRSARCLYQSAARTLRVRCGRGVLNVSTVCVANLAGDVWSRSARCFHHLGPELCKCRVVAGRPDVFTAWGPNLASAVRSRSARCLHHLCANLAGAVWSRSA